MPIAAVMVVTGLALAAPALPPTSEPETAPESAPPSDGAPPVQRPSTMPPPSEAPPPTAVETPPVTTPPPVESPPQPIETPTEAPPPVVTAPAPAPAPRIEAPTDTADPFDEDEPARPSISPIFRRPGIWVGTDVALLVASTVLRFILPVVSKPKGRCLDGCPEHEINGPTVAVLMLSIPVDAMTMVSFGFAGRGYGLHAARSGTSRRRAPFVGTGAALIVAGAAFTLASAIRPVVKDEPSGFSYEMCGVRHAGIVAASAGAFLVGYGAAQPRDGYAAHAQRRFAIAPSFGRTHVGVALAWRR